MSSRNRSQLRDHQIFFQPSVNIQSAEAEVAGLSQTVLKQMPPGITPPTILIFNASSVPILQLALSSDSLSQTALFDDAASFIRPQLASVAGASIPLPYAARCGRCRPTSTNRRCIPTVFRP